MPNGKNGARRAVSHEEYRTLLTVREFTQEVQLFGLDGPIGRFMWGEVKEGREAGVLN